MYNFIKNIINRVLLKFRLKIIRLNNSLSLINEKELISFDRDSFNHKLYIEGLKISKNEKSENFFKKSRFLDLINLVELTLEKNDVDDFVEAGCWFGHSSYIIASIIKKSSKKNINFHIFDSFEGLSEVTESDRDLSKLDKNDVLKIRSQFKSNEVFVKKEVLGNFDFVKIYKGWIPEKFNLVEDKKFSFVHIDVDLYKPTLDTLEFFYPKLSKGGIILCDDYNSKGFDGAKEACDKYFRDKDYSFKFSPSVSGFFVIK
tara:strand:- start:489 stop:1265 length:777 start_codon:yes stop_codon:yes gene_type:complete